MGLVHLFTKSRRPVSLLLYAFVVISLPPLMGIVASVWASHSIWLFVFSLIITLFYAALWPVIMIRQLDYLGLSRLWIFLILLPMSFLVLSLWNGWLVAKLAMIIAVLVQVPLLFVTPRPNTGGSSEVPDL